MLGGSMSRQYLSSYAQYMLKFIQAYAAEGVSVRAVTTQNEIDTDQHGQMPACTWSQECETEFITDHIGPLFEKTGTTTKIWILDHNYVYWGRVISELDNPGFRRYVNSVAWHGYVGVPNGLTTGDANNLGLSKTSRPGDYFRAPHAPAVIISYAEVLFDLSEAVSRGFITGDAADLYNKAVLASLDQYGIKDATITANYLAQPSVQYDAVNFKKSLGDQKWIALFGQGLEAFAEWRRLDYPLLSPAVAGTLGGKMPERLIYPGSEQTLNGANYTSAVQHQGADLLTTKLWFDKN